MANETEPPEPDLPNIRKHLRTAPSLRRLFGWGSMAALALGALVIVSQTKGGSERLQQAIVAVASEPARPEVARIAEKDIETRRLEAKLRALEADRDRLTARIASLERNLDDTTGSIRKQVEQIAAAPPPAAPVPPIPAAPIAAAAVTTAPAPSPPPAVAMTAPPVIAPAASIPTLAPLAMPAANAAGPGWSDPPQVQANEPVSTPQAPSPLTEAVPMPPVPPVRVAAAPASEPAPQTGRLDYGVDLGSGANMDALRTRWAMVKANFGPHLAGLNPIAVRDQRPGSTDMRLIVGPLPNAAAARKLCAQFTAAQTACRTARYDGEALNR